MASFPSDPSLTGRASMASSYKYSPARYSISGPDAIVIEAKRKFHQALEDQLLDYKHNHPITIQACADLLVKIFNNVLNNPNEQRFRRVKATSNAFKAVLACKGGENLMMLAGWRTEIVEMQRYWVFEGLPGTHKFIILQYCKDNLERAIDLIHDKAERKKKEVALKQAEEKARVASVLAALEDDKVDRRLRTSTMMRTGHGWVPEFASPPGASPVASANNSTGGAQNGSARPDINTHPLTSLSRADYVRQSSPVTDRS